MRLQTLIRYLLGDRAAILNLASNRWSLVVGFLFVLSAAFAREYDGKDLLAEPWHLFTPLIASLAASFIVFAFSCRATSRHLTGYTSYLSAYSSFLGLFWLTAPLAWLYAVPYERFLSPLGAIQANLATLGVVAAWRVFLMGRVLKVVMNYSTYAAFVIIAIISDGLMMLAMFSTTFGLMVTMGGMHQISETARFVEQTASALFQIGFLGFFALPVSASSATSNEQPRWQAARASWAEPAYPTFGVWTLALFSLAVWGVVLPFTQPEQQLRLRVEYAFKEGRIADGLAEMSAHDRVDFPPHWEPPPDRVDPFHQFGEPNLIDVCVMMELQPTAGWVREIYLAKLRDVLCDAPRLTDEDCKRLASLFGSIPEGPAILTAMEQSKWQEYNNDSIKTVRHYMNEPNIEPKKKADEPKEDPDW